MAQLKTSGSAPVLSLPPYGYMHQGWLRDIELAPVPEGFRVKGVLGSVQDYDRFIDEVSNEIAEVLWPRYDFKQRVWKGKAAAQAEALTRADFQLMASLRERLDDEVVVPEKKRAEAVIVPEVKKDGTVVVPAQVRAESVVRKMQRLGKNQKALFRLEDTSARGTIDLYLKDVKDAAPEVLEAVKRSVDAGFARLGRTTLRFKQELQRPRPYQVAFMFGEDFKYEYGASAVTPSLISGHCMQGLFIRGYATLMHRRTLEEHAGAMAAMQRYCIEIGDRRVYAGVHYPSDNLSSWYGCLRLCHHSFESFGQEAKTFMWEAIQDSEVYQTMLAASTGKHPIYAPALKWLAEEAARKV